MAIHAAGIVHRDLSPQNVLRMGDGRLVLSDFGLATDASESTSVHGGTIAYMAPEVMRGDRSTVASDIWSLGALMYELVFGDKPRWSDGAAPEILTPVLGRKLTEEERAVLETCRACTVKDPGTRIASAAAAAGCSRSGGGGGCRGSVGARAAWRVEGALSSIGGRRSQCGSYAAAARRPRNRLRRRNHR